VSHILRTASPNWVSRNPKSPRKIFKGTVEKIHKNFKIMRKIPNTPINFRGTYVSGKHPQFFKTREVFGEKINPFTTA
jgi:hypothetical protein